MNIDEAIKILEHVDDTYQTYTVTIRNRAAKLGIEALKFVLQNRGKGAGHVPTLLLGETKE